MIYIGLPQWSHPKWVRLGITSLEEYARHFNCVEGNTTLYALPKPEVVLRWREQTTDDFRFCFKFPATISHQAALRHCDDLVTEFLTRMSPLAPRIGQYWLQLPATFGPRELPALWHFLDSLPGEFNYGVEVRHPQFFAKGEEEQTLNQFTPEQVAAMQSYGFTESAGDWSLGLSDAILFAKNDYKLLPESQQQIQTMAAKLASTGLTHARMDGHTDNYGEDSYNEGLSLKRANVVADAWAMGGQIPRSNLTTQGLGKKYPIASNKTAQGRGLHQRGVNRVILDSRPVHAARPHSEAIRDAQRKKPKVPVHAVLTATNPLIRFIGSDDMTQNRELFQVWLQKLAQWHQTTTPYLFLHTPDIAQAPELVHTLWEDLRKTLPEIGAVPAIPQQSSLF